MLQDAGVPVERGDAEKDECIARNQEMCNFGTGFTFLIGNAGIGDVQLGFNLTGAPWNQCILNNQGGIGADIIYECLAFSGSMFDSCCSMNNFPECDIVLSGDISSQEVVDASNSLYGLCDIDIRDFISTCSNNCRGVRLDNIIAGGLDILSTTAVTSLATASSPLLPLLDLG